MKVGSKNWLHFIYVVKEKGMKYNYDTNTGAAAVGKKHVMDRIDVVQ